jgi:hypothetical protein
MTDHRSDGEHQRAGVDRSITMSNGSVVLVDEKVRFRNKNGHVYDDVFLEIISNKEKRIPGWVLKQLRAQYIAYLIAPLGVCYILPVDQLQLAFLSNWCSWESQYSVREVYNNGWTTVGVPVPADVLFRAIGQQLRIRCMQFEENDISDFSFVGMSTEI